MAVRGALGDDSHPRRPRRAVAERDETVKSAHGVLAAGDQRDGDLESRRDGATPRELRGVARRGRQSDHRAHRAGPQGLGRLRGVHREGGARAEADESGGANVDRVVEDEGSVRLGETRDGGERAKRERLEPRVDARVDHLARALRAGHEAAEDGNGGAIAVEGAHAHGAAHHHAARREKAKHGVVSGGPSLQRVAVGGVLVKSQDVAAATVGTGAEGASSESNAAG